MASEPTKGAFRGLCNRAACLAPDATFFNRTTGKYYCLSCAMRINDTASSESVQLCGTYLLCLDVDHPAHPFFEPAPPSPIPPFIAESAMHPANPPASPVPSVEATTLRAVTISRVQQLDPLGCGVACLAMVSGRSYEDVRATVNPAQVEHGLADRTVLWWLNNERFWTRRSWPEGEFAQPLPTTGSAVALTHDAHWIVLHDGLVLDPARESPLPTYDIRQVIEVRPPALLRSAAEPSDTPRACPGSGSGGWPPHPSQTPACARCGGAGSITIACPGPAAEPSEDEAHGVALEVLCRVFDDGADEGMEEWRAWYQPHQWLNGSRALGAFIRQRLDTRSARSSSSETDPNG